MGLVVISLLMGINLWGFVCLCVYVVVVVCVCVCVFVGGGQSASSSSSSSSSPLSVVSAAKGAKNSEHQGTLEVATFSVMCYSVSACGLLVVSLD